MNGVYYCNWTCCLHYFLSIPHDVSLLRETYATVRSQRYEPSWPQRHGFGHVRAVDPAVPDWDLVPVHHTTPHHQTTYPDSNHRLQMMFSFDRHHHLVVNSHVYGAVATALKQRVGKLYLHGSLASDEYGEMISRLPSRQQSNLILAQNLPSLR